MRPVLFYSFGALVLLFAIIRIVTRRASRLEAVAWFLMSGCMIISGTGTEAYNLDFVGIGMMIVALVILAFNPRPSSPTKQALPPRTGG